MRSLFAGMPAVLYKESIHVTRDPLTLLLMLIIPGIQLTVFGYAIEVDVKNIPTVVYNMDSRPASHDLLDRYVNSGYFEIVSYAYSNAELNDAIVRGDAKVGITIPPDYSEKLLLRRPVEVQVLIDGSDSTVAMQALNVSNAIALRMSIDVVASQMDGESVRPLIDSRPRMLFNPNMETANFMVPALVGIVMQIVTMFLTAFAIVREKENGTLEQLMVTPVSRLGLMVGKLGPYAVIGATETVIVLLLMRFVFQVPIEGSILLLAGFSVVFLFTALGLGLMISTIAQTQIQAIQIAFVIMLPSILLSGFIFPQESMPAPIYVIGQVFPVTYFIRILRGVILRGAGFSDLWVDGAWLALIGVIVLAISTARFRKTTA